MIDSKRLIEVMPRLSGNEYKVFLYLLYGYDMARNAYNQPYYERSQSKIEEDTGVKETTLKRAIDKLEEQRLITCERAQKGSVKACTKYYILDYDTYTVQNNHSNPVQNELYIIDNDNKDIEATKKTVLPDLYPLYTKSKQYGDMLGFETTIEGINRIKDEFLKLWDDGKALYKYEDRYQADKDKNWQAFRKRYDGAKSRINRSTNKHTPKEDKKDKRESANLNGGGGAFTPLFDINIYNPWLLETDFKPQYFYQYINAAYSKMKTHKSQWNKKQLEHTIKSAQDWINKTWNREKNEEVNTNEKEDDGSYIALNYDEWNIYVRNYLESAYKDAIGECASNTQSS